MAKQANDEGSFDKVFLEYLRLRFEFEPLPHYVMVAMQSAMRQGTITRRSSVRFLLGSRTVSCSTCKASSRLKVIGATERMRVGVGMKIAMTC